MVIVYAARATGGSLAVDEESLEAAEFTADTLPWSELAFRSTGDGLRDYMAGLLHPFAP